MLVLVARARQKSMKTLKKILKRAAAKIVPKLLNFEQKQLRMVITQEMLAIQIYSKY